MKKLFLLIFFLCAAAGFAYLSGYRFHAENLPYYYQISAKGQKQEVLFRDGKTLTGVITDETEDEIKVDVEGAAMMFSRASIQSVQPVKGSSPWQIFYENYKKYEKLHPLVTQDKTVSLSAKIDDLMMEPSKIADQIKQNNPGMAGNAQIQAALESVRAAQAQASAQRAAAEAEMQRMEEGV